jgi:hypothetical protein
MYKGAFGEFYWAYVMNTSGKQAKGKGMHWSYV